MNALDYAVNEVRNKIPYEILYAGMTYAEDPNMIALSSLEDKIVQRVIKKRVLLMCNVIGGIQVIVPIRQLYPSIHDNLYTVYPIPPELVMDKEIVSVLNLAYMPGTGFMGSGSGYGGVGHISSLTDPSFYSSNPVTNVTGRIGAAASTNGVLSNAHLEIVARNTVAVYANYRTLGNFGITCLLENDSNLANLQPRSYHQLGRLCELATKAYIHNKLIIPLNSGMLSGGQDLGVFRSIVESYSSAEEDYQTFITEVWGKVMYHNDVHRTHRLVTSMISPDL